MATNMTAPSRTSILLSMAAPPSRLIAAAEHLRIAGLVARARREEALTLDASLLGGGGALGLDQRFGSAIGRQQRDQIGKLLRLQREKLVACLSCLQRAARILALPNEGSHFSAVGVDIADHAGLDAHRILQAAHGVSPAPARIRDQLLIGGRERDLAVLLLERLIDLAD